MEIIDFLFENQDQKYAEFSVKLIPNIDPKKIIGVRIPIIRSLAKTLTEDEKEVFLNALPHKYHEENLLHGFIVQNTKDFDLALMRTEKFIKYIDNWMVSDTITPKCFSKHKKEMLPIIKKWIHSGETYLIRFGVVTLMNQYMNHDFDKTDIDLVLSSKMDDYYVKMMIAWYLATALVKHYDITIKYFEEKNIDKWVHNKAIQKSIESYRITNEHKNYLRTLKIK